MGISILDWLLSLDPYWGLGMITKPIWKCPCINLHLLSQYGAFIRSCYSKKNRQNNGLELGKTNTQKNNGQHYTTQKIKDRANGTPLKRLGGLRCSGRVNSSCSTSGTLCVMNEVWTWMCLREAQHIHVRDYF